MFDEEAKAIQETAKATGKGFDLLASTGKNLEPFGGMLKDWGNHLRYRNVFRLNDKTTALIAQRRAQGKMVPIAEGFILPLLEAASLECEDEVQDLWAALIVNASDPEKRFVLRKVYIDILRGLQAVDVQVLKTITSGPIPTEDELRPEDRGNAEAIAERAGVPLDEVQVSLQTLGRFACIIDTRRQTYDSLDQAHSGIRVNDPNSNFRLSDLGRRLLAATSAQSVHAHAGSTSG